MISKRFGWTAFLLTALTGTLAQSQDAPPPAGGKVIFSREGDSVAPGQSAQSETTPALGKEDPLGVVDAERRAITFTSYDLDAHLTVASSAISMRAVVTLRNDGSAPLSKAILHIFIHAALGRCLGGRQVTTAEKPAGRDRCRPHGCDERGGHHVG